MFGTIGVPEFIFMLLFWAIWSVVGRYVATQKRRSAVEGFVLGMLGPLGVIIEALLPTNPANITN